LFFWRSPAVLLQFSWSSPAVLLEFSRRSPEFNSPSLSPSFSSFLLLLLLLLLLLVQIRLWCLKMRSQMTQISL